MSNILTSREYNTANYEDLPRSWYAPEQLLERFKSVEYAYLTNTTSTAGDWQGFIVQRIKGRGYVIPFSQYNNYPHAGFTVYTSDHPVFTFDGEMSREDIINELYEDSE